LIKHLFCRKKVEELGDTDPCQRPDEVPANKGAWLRESPIDLPIYENRRRALMKTGSDHQSFATLQVVQLT
jgi:hypothetical protein